MDRFSYPNKRGGWRINLEIDHHDRHMLQAVANATGRTMQQTSYMLFMQALAQAYQAHHPHGLPLDHQATLVQTDSTVGT